MLTAHVFTDVFRQIITRHTDGVVGNNTSQRDNGNFRRTTTYVHNHIPFRSLYINADTNSRSHRFEDQIDIPSTGMFGRVTNGTEFNFRTTRRNTDHHTKRG